MTDRIVIGKILKPQGIRGELKVLPITSDPERFRELKYVCVGDCAEHTKVLSVRVSGAEVFLFLERVIDRSAAEALRGQYLSVEREDAVKEEGSYFICDLEGCRVTLDDGTELGILTEVLQQSGADVYWVKKPGRKKGVLFPALSELFVSIDTESASIVLHADRFREVACFEE